MIYFILGFITGFLALVAIAFIDAKVKKKKIKKIMEQSAEELKLYGFDISKFTKGEK